jgi:hypothetical protein
MNHKGLQLNYINSTNDAVDLENTDTPKSVSALHELDTLIADSYNEDITHVVVTLPSESVFVSQFPGKQGLDENMLQQLVSLEIRQTYPQLNYGDFSSVVIPMEPRLDNKQMMLATIIPKQLLKIVYDLFANHNLTVNDVEICQFNAHKALDYNYPELKDKTVAVLGFQNQFVDVSVFKDDKPIYYNLTNLTDKTRFLKMCDSEMNKLLADYVNKIDTVLLFGASLTPELLQISRNALKNYVTECNRLNAFRLITPNVGEREREYCSRTAHIYPPCVGACVLPGYERIRLM